MFFNLSAPAQIAVLAAVAAMLLSPSIGRANWQNTKWGMSEEQVRAVVPGLRKTSADQRNGKKYIDGGEPILTGRYRSEGISYTPFFYFGGDRPGLSRVVLSLDLASMCGDIGEKLTKRYGSPTNVTNHPGFGVSIWSIGGEEISLVRISKGEDISDCGISYRPTTKIR